MRRLAYQYATQEKCIVPPRLPCSIYHREVHSNTLCLFTVIFFQLKYGILLRNLSVSFRVHFKEYFLNGAPLGSAGSANKSGWMSDQDFVLFMKHFIQHVQLSKENEVLLLLDNQCSVCV
jgi:hypothetical protein